MLGSKVTVWVTKAGLVHLTVSPTPMVTVSGRNLLLGACFIVTSTVLAWARAGAAQKPRPASISAKTRRLIVMILSCSLWRRNLVDQQIGERTGIEGKGIGVVHGGLVQYDVGIDLEFANRLGVLAIGEEGHTREGAPCLPVLRTGKSV